MLQLINPLTTQIIIHKNNWYWGKATTIDKNKIEMLMNIVTCKDYIVDNLFQTHRTTNQTKDNITDKERYENCIYIFFPNEQIATNVINNINTFLNPWFKKNGISPTTIEQASWTKNTYDNLLYVIKGDNKWTLNSFGWSIYLSIIRLMGVKPNLTSIPLDIDNNNAKISFYTNELGYIDGWKRNNQPNIVKNLIDIFNNPFPYLIKLDDPYDISGYYKSQSKSHGITGPFYIITLIYNAHTYKRDYNDHIHLNNYFYKLLVNKVYPPTIKKDVRKPTKSPAMPKVFI